MWFLILSTVSILIPEKYPTAKDCNEAGAIAYERKARPQDWFMCVPAPKPTKCRTEADGPNARMVCE